MRVTISHKNLKKALNTVEKVVSRNTTLPVLSNVLIKTENGRLKMSATNLEIGINYFIGAKIENPGEIAVPVRIFSDFINNINEEKIDLTVKSNTITITHDKQKTNILAVNPKDFPIIPKIKNDKPITVLAKVLKQSLSSVFDSVAISETRPELAGVFIQAKGNKLCFAATDSFRLAEKNVVIKSDNTHSLILPRNTAAELIRILNDFEGDISFKIGEGQVSFSNEDFEIISRTIDGNYPDYKKVIPDKWVSKALIPKDEFEQKIKLAGLFSSNIADVRIYCEGKSVTISAKNPDKGETQLSLEAVIKNEPFDLSLNYRYLLDGIKTISTKNIIIEFAGTGSPIVIRPEGDSSDMLYLIMPLRN